MGRREVLTALIVVLVASTTLWQFHSYLYQDKAGDVFIVNRITGMITRLETVVPAKPELARQKRTWEKVPLPTVGGGTSATLETKWLSGKLLYHLTLASITDRIKKARGNPFAHYSLILQDADGFPIVTESIPLNKFVQIFEESDKPTRMESFGSVPLEVKAYDTIAGWNLEWALGANP
jgi:hypothetical protein